MARPTASLRLSQIDPVQLVRDVNSALAEHIATLARIVAPGYTVHLTGPVGDTDIGLTLLDLARYAVGLDAHLDGPVSDYALSLLALLDAPLRAEDGQHPPPLDRWLSGRVDLSGLDPESLPDRLCLVVTAAFGREALAAGAPLSVAQLAALVGVDPDHVRLLGRRGEIVVESGHVSAGEAQRWLSTRVG